MNARMVEQLRESNRKADAAASDFKVAKSFDATSEQDFIYAEFLLKELRKSAERYHDLAHSYAFNDCQHYACVKARVIVNNYSRQDQGRQDDQ